MDLEGRADKEAALARQALDGAFEAADESVAPEKPAVGLFGYGLPETLIAAAAATPIHVNFGSMPDRAPMDDVIEPFVDSEVRTFLNRFASGAFDRMRGIVFARDDAAAFTAYQYATEWVRQGQGVGTRPRLFLFNLVHASTPAATRFNRIQLDKLIGYLVEIGLSAPTERAMEESGRVAAERRALLAGVAAIVDPGTSSRWRNAGRFMTAHRHRQLLDTALVGMVAARAAGRRVALLGSPIAAPAFYDMLASFGELVCDLQSSGHIWPGEWEAHSDADRLLATLSADAFSPRISPPQRYRKALFDAITTNECDLVVCQLAQTDDTFGWEVPGLRAQLEERGIPFINLGFRDQAPGQTWLEQAARQISRESERRT